MLIVQRGRVAAREHRLVLGAPDDPLGEGQPVVEGDVAATAVEQRQPRLRPGQHPRPHVHGTAERHRADGATHRADPGVEAVVVDLECAGPHHDIRVRAQRRQHRADPVEVRAATRRDDGPGPLRIQAGVGEIAVHRGESGEVGVDPGDRVRAAVVRKRALVAADSGELEHFRGGDGLGDSAGGALISSAQHNSRPIYWSPGVGLRDLIGEAGASGQALSISPDGTVVGWYKGADERQRAFVWTPVTGLIDLNTLLPAGQNLHLESAYQNTDGGHIVAIANGNPFLLAPADTPSPPSHPPIVEDIEGPDVVNVATGFTVSARFTDTDVGDQHHASWAWADGTEVDVGTITATEGGYLITGSHSYATAGVHEITLTLTDAANNQVATTRKITVVDGAAGQVLGAGHFVSPVGALKSRPDVAGRAELAFVAGHGDNGNTPYGALAFRFRAAELIFKATDFATLSLSGHQAWITGTGELNGEGGYPFSVQVFDAASAETKARVRFQITAPDGSVRYDNQPAAGGEGSNLVGVALTGGTVKIREED